MEYIKYGLLVVIPYIVYAVVLHFLEDRYEIELSKMLKGMIFITIDIFIFMIFNTVGK